MKRGCGLDAGHSAVRLLEVQAGKGGVAVTRYHALALEPGETPPEAAGAAFGQLRRKPAAVRVGLTGADVMMRYLPVPEVEDWRLLRLMDFEVRELESRSGAPLANSFNLLPVPKELDEEDTMLLALVREDLLNEWMAALGRLPVQGFSPNAIALYNAYLALGDHEPSVTLLANLGASTLDLALVRGAELYFARSVSTSLDKRDATLAERLKIDAPRARRLIHKHLDLGGALGKRLEVDDERVTRPLLPLYDPLPTLLGGVVTLCKAQARLRDLGLDRVLITGGGAATRGLEAFLTDRLRVPVTLWNPVELVDASALPEDQYAQLNADGPAAAVALGLALSVADPGLFALEILPKAARKKREFRERGVFTVAAAGLAAAFLALEFFVQSGRAGEAADEARTLRRQVEVAAANDAKARQLAERLTGLQGVAADLTARLAVRRSAQELLATLAGHLPENLWVDGLKVELAPGDEWQMPGRLVPVVAVNGRGVTQERPAASLFTEFCEKLKSGLPGRDAAMRYSSNPQGQGMSWNFVVHLLSDPALQPAAEEEQEPQ